MFCAPANTPLQDIGTGHGSTHQSLCRTRDDIVIGRCHLRCSTGTWCGLRQTNRKKCFLDCRVQCHQCRLQSSLFRLGRQTASLIGHRCQGCQNCLIHLLLRQRIAPDYLTGQGIDQLQVVNLCHLIEAEIIYCQPVAASARCLETNLDGTRQGREIDSIFPGRIDRGLLLVGIDIGTRTLRRRGTLTQVLCPHLQLVLTSRQVLQGLRQRSIAHPIAGRHPLLGIECSCLIREVGVRLQLQSLVGPVLETGLHRSILDVTRRHVGLGVTNSHDTKTYI